MKTEHEKLKEVCDKIGYKLNEVLYFYDDIKKCFRDCYGDCRRINVREIIFTPKFIKKLENYCYDNISKDLNMLKIMIMSNLNNPVEYLYNLIFNK